MLRTSLVVLGWLLLLCCSGCGTERRLQEPVAAAPDDWAREAPAGIDPADWFNAWDVPQLQALIAEAMRRNPDLATRLARLREAEALARERGSSLWPQVDLETGVRRSEQPVPELGAADGGTRTETTWSARLSASYEIDLWGRLLHARDAASIEALARAADLRAAGIALAARIASSWLALLEQRRRLALIEERLELLHLQQALARRTYGQGLRSGDHLHQTAQTVAAAREAATALAQRLAETRHRLAVLLGRPPGAVQVHRRSLPRPPPIPDAGLPADLLARRPDLIAAGQRIAAADLRLAAREADRWPRLRLRASLFTEADTPGGLADRILWSIFGGLIQPLIDGHRLAARAQQARARLQAQTGGFRTALLQALREVADALSAHQHQEERLQAGLLRLQAQEARVQAHRRAVAQGVGLRTGTGNGSGDAGLAALLHQRARLLRLQATALELRRALAETRIGLYRSLGGDWDSGPAVEALEAGDG